MDTVKEKRIAFVFAALLAGLSGWLYAYLLRFVNPSPFSLSIGIEYLFMVVVAAPAMFGAPSSARRSSRSPANGSRIFLPSLGTSGNFETVVFGGLIIFLLHRADGGVAERLAGLVRRLPFLHPSDAGEGGGRPAVAGAPAPPRAAICWWWTAR